MPCDDTFKISIRTLKKESFVSGVPFGLHTSLLVDEDAGLRISGSIYHVNFHACRVEVGWCTVSNAFWRID